MKIEIQLAGSTDQLEQIVDLQKSNLQVNVSDEESANEGFVTIAYSLEDLKALQAIEPQVIALADGMVVGYALVMTRQSEALIDWLEPMFQKINSVDYQGERLGNVNYLVMGQICIAKEFRKLGIFRSLYEFYQQQFSTKYPYLITEVARTNPRSHQAHLAIGFKEILLYELNGDHWHLILWDWRS